MSWQLKKNANFGARPGPVVVIVMDGVGEGRKDESDAVFLARTPLLDKLRAEAPFRLLRAHGLAVGLPSDDDMGNSEVGHNAIGAGRVFSQGAKLVNQAIESGAMFQGQTWLEATQRVKDRGSALHFLGLLSDGNVHSHIKHLEAMIAEAHRIGVKKVYVHALIDGRDVPETSALIYAEAIERCLAQFHHLPEYDYRVASGGGRMKITMDRYEADWGMVELGWQIHVKAEGPRFPSLSAAIQGMREAHPGVIDQDLPPFVIGDAEGPVAPVKDGDSLLFFNFRGDRAIEISRAFEDDSVPFERGKRPDVYYAGMMQYDGDYNIPARYLVSPPNIERTLGEYLAKNQVSQFACSETQKYGHVTYFWNGNRSGMFDEHYERYQEVPSDRVSFDERPWMKAAEITDATIAAVKSGKYRFIRINYPNGDMVGHTGNRDAAIVGVETVDLGLRRLLPVIQAAGGVALITADHGNADEMYMFDKKKQGFKHNPDGSIEAKTSHTLNPVPLYLFDPLHAGKLAFKPGMEAAGLSNVASTALNLLGYDAPLDFEPGLLLPL